MCQNLLNQLVNRKIAALYARSFGSFLHHIRPGHSAAVLSLHQHVLPKTRRDWRVLVRLLLRLNRLWISLDAMGLSWYGGVHKWGYPQSSSIFGWDFPIQSIHLELPSFMDTPICHDCCLARVSLVQSCSRNASDTSEGSHHLDGFSISWNQAALPVDHYLLPGPRHTLAGNEWVKSHPDESRSEVIRQLDAEHVNNWLYLTTIVGLYCFAMLFLFFLSQSLNPSSFPPL